MKTNILKYLATAAVAVGLTLSTQAIPITGSITLKGGAQFADGSGTVVASVNNATQVLQWSPNNTVESVSGAFAAILPNTPATMIAPWIFNPSTPLPALWSVGGFTFDLQTSTITTQGGGFLNVLGIGTITAAGYDPTSFSWAFSSQDPASGRPPTWSWSAAANGIPDGGMTAILLGAALSGLGLLRRKLA
jgi:hypothetical protein